MAGTQVANKPRGPVLRSVVAVGKRNKNSDLFISLEAACHSAIHEGHDSQWVGGNVCGVANGHEPDKLWQALKSRLPGHIHVVNNLYQRWED